MAKKKKTSKKIPTAEETAHKKKKRKHHESPLTTTSQQQQSTTKPPKKKEKKKSKRALKEEAEERRLTALLFGGGTETNVSVEEEKKEAESKQQQQQDPQEEEEQESSLLFEIDRTGVEGEAEDDDNDSHEGKAAAQVSRDDNLPIADSDSDTSSSDEDSGGPAWVDDDDDDDNVQVNLLEEHRLKKLRQHRSEDQPLNASDLQKRLRARYKTTMQLTAQTTWARLDDDDNNDDSDEEDDETATSLQSSSQPLLMGASSRRLPPNILNIMRCPDANQSDYNQAVVQAVNFHPGSNPDQPLLLTAGLDKTLRFFQVSAEKSEKIHGIHFPKLPIYSAHFLGDTGKVVVSGRRPFFYIYDSIAGKLDHVPRILGREEKSLERCFSSPDGKTIAFVGNDGYVILVDVRSKQWMASLKLNGSVRAITFTADGQYILASGSDGDVYRWDVASRRCVERFPNQDGTITSYLAASPRRQLAVGSESGVVNLYSDEVRRQAKATMNTQARTPLKSVMNLPTSADMLRYNHDGQILAMSSRRERNSLKLLHVPTSTVFSNWPTSKTPLQYVSSLDFSPQSKFMAVGNDKGKCLLYQLHHYSQS